MFLGKRWWHLVWCKSNLIFRTIFCKNTFLLKFSRVRPIDCHLFLTIFVIFFLFICWQNSQLLLCAVLLYTRYTIYITEVRTNLKAALCWLLEARTVDTENWGPFIMSITAVVLASAGDGRTMPALTAVWLMCVFLKILRLLATKDAIWVANENLNENIFIFEFSFLSVFYSVLNQFQFVVPPIW